MVWRSTAAGEGPFAFAQGRSAPHTPPPRASVLPVPAPNRIKQFVGVVADAVFENDFDFLNIRNLLGRIALDHDQVCILSSCDRADLTLSAQVGGAVQSGDLDRFDGRESGFDQQFSLALISEAGEHVAGAGGIRTRD